MSFETNSEKQPKPVNSEMIIKIFVIHLNEYLLQISHSPEILNSCDAISIIQTGIKLLLHVFALLHNILPNIEEYFTQTQRSYLLYLEYIKQIYLKHVPSSVKNKRHVIDILSNNDKMANQKSSQIIAPSIFVYTRIFEKYPRNLESTPYNSIFKDLYEWVDAILAIDQFKPMIDNYDKNVIQNILLQFHDTKLYKLLYLLIERTNGNENPVSFSEWSDILKGLATLSKNEINTLIKKIPGIDIQQIDSIINTHNHTLWIKQILCIDC